METTLESRDTVAIEQILFDGSIPEYHNFASVRYSGLCKILGIDCLRLIGLSSQSLLDMLIGVYLYIYICVHTYVYMWFPKYL